MDEAAKRPDEAVADVHKALAKERAGKTYGAAARSMSDSHTLERGDSATKLKAPGGFRRHYLNEQADVAGVPLEGRPGSWQRSFMETLRSSVSHHEALLGIRLDAFSGEEVADPKGTAGLPQTAVAVLKSFVGSGITFLPCAFAQGGWAFAVPMIAMVAAMNAVCIWLLLECRTQTGCHSFGEIAQLAAGAKGKVIVQVSVVISQFAICIAYIIFVGQLAASMHLWTTTGVVFLQLVILTPLCMIRSVERLEYPNLLADVLILLGLAIVLVSSIATIGSFRHNGLAPPKVVPFRQSTFGIFIGMSIFTFEGVPMILPIQNSMREPDRFWSLFWKQFIGIVLLFIIFGLVGYVAYGEQVDTVVLLNLPHHSWIAGVVKVGYMLALILSLPLMFLPAARITELWVFGVVKPSHYRWEKSILRAAEVGTFAILAFLCQDSFDRFLSFTGAFCCAPIAFIYPTLFHFRLCAQSKGAQARDLGLMLLGLAAVVSAFYGSFLS